MRGFRQNRRLPSGGVGNAEYSRLLGPEEWKLDSSREADDGQIGRLPAFDNRPGASPENAWWKGNTDEVAEFWWGYESLWLPSTLLKDDGQQHLTDALFEASRHFNFALHFNKGLGGSPPEALALAKDTCTNPAVLDAFAQADSLVTKRGPINYLCEGRRRFSFRF